MAPEVVFSNVFFFLISSFGNTEIEAGDKELLLSLVIELLNDFLFFEKSATFLWEARKLSFVLFSEPEGHSVCFLPSLINPQYPQQRDKTPSVGHTV